MTKDEGCQNGTGADPSETRSTPMPVFLYSLSAGGAYIANTSAPVMFSVSFAKS